MNIIDFHAHIYPAKIAMRATQAIGNFYNAPISFNGSIPELIASGEKIGVERYIVHSTATKPDQVISINDFIIGETEKEPRFTGFGTLHPDFQDIRTELERIVAKGLKGIKLHPDFQRFEVDSPKMDAIRHNSPASIGDTKKRRMPNGHERGWHFSIRLNQPCGKLPFENATFAKRAVVTGNRSE